MTEEKEKESKWQAVMLVIDRRLECSCGNIAIFVTGKIGSHHYNTLQDVDVWCQQCFKKAQEGE